jgi:hypothetical protein
MRPVLEDLDADLRALLDAAAPGIVPPPEAQGRVARRLAVAVAALPAATSGLSASHAARPSYIAGALRKTGAWAPKPVVAAFVAGALAGVGGYAATLSRHAAAPAPRVEPGVAVEANASAPVVPAEQPSAPPVFEAPGPRAEVASASSSREADAPSSPAARSPRTSDLDAERQILDVGRRALATGEPEDVLRATRQHERRFPEGALVEEREALAIQALVVSSRLDEARARAGRFAAKFPDSLLGPVVQAAIDTIPK